MIAYQRFDYKIYYWRTVSGVEVDFVLYGEKALFALEIKHAKTINPTMLTGLRHFKEDYPMAKCIVLYLGEETRYLADSITAVPFVDGLKQLAEWLSQN